jgi:hypothetical protein
MAIILLEMSEKYKSNCAQQPKNVGVVVQTTKRRLNALEEAKKVA